MSVKQVILVRSDIGMPYGKAIAQGAHASMMFMTKRLQHLAQRDEFIHPSHIFTNAEWEWINGTFTKIALEVKTEDELLDLHQKALEVGLQSHLVLDSGKTHTHGVPTHTCIAIGPDDADKINQITGHLRPYLQPGRKP